MAMSIEMQYERYIEKFIKDDEGDCADIRQLKYNALWEEDRDGFIHVLPGFKPYRPYIKPTPEKEPEVKKPEANFPPKHDQVVFEMNELTLQKFGKDYYSIESEQSTSKQQCISTCTSRRESGYSTEAYEKSPEKENINFEELCERDDDKNKIDADDEKPNISSVDEPRKSDDYKNKFDGDKKGNINVEDLCKFDDSSDNKIDKGDDNKSMNSSSSMDDENVNMLLPSSIYRFLE